jgi:hypothetical protein
MKVFNLTDVTTPALKQRALEAQHIEVQGAMLEPGGSVEVDDAALAPLQHLVDLGVLVFGTPPSSYLDAKKAPAPVRSALVSTAAPDTAAGDKLPASSDEPATKADRKAK